MKFKLTYLLLFLIGLSLLGTLLVFPILPDKIPTHWNISGEVDTYSNKTAIIWLSILPLGIFFLMKFLPHIDPKKENYKKHKKAYDITIAGTIIIFLILNWISIAFSLGVLLNVKLFVNLLIGILFIVIGNFMPQIRHNYFFGIKSPWCLSSETVWRKTHRLGGFAFIFSGIFFIINGFLNNVIFSYLTFTTIIFISLGLYIYSYIIFRKENLKK